MLAELSCVWAVTFCRKEGNGSIIHINTSGLTFDRWSITIFRLAQVFRMIRVLDRCALPQNRQKLGTQFGILRQWEARCGRHPYKMRGLVSWYQLRLTTENAVLREFLFTLMNPGWSAVQPDSIIVGEFRIRAPYLRVQTETQKMLHKMSEKDSGHKPRTRQPCQQWFRRWKGVLCWAGVEACNTLFYRFNTYCVFVLIENIYLPEAS